MKKLILFAFIQALVIACTPKTADNTQISTQQIDFSVKGMTCTHCETAIKNGVLKLDGIDSVSASFENGQVSVYHHNAMLTESEIVSAIESKGYKVIGIGEQKPE